MSNDAIKCIGHMVVAQVPGAYASTEHRAVVALRVGNNLGVLAGTLVVG